MTTIHVHRDSAMIGDARITFRYDPELVDLIKGRVPVSGRSYDPSTKTWTLRYPHLDIVLSAARALGHTVNEVPVQQQHRQPPPPPRPRTTEVQTWADGVLGAVGPDRAEAVFRALTKVLHPDVPTGDTQLMQQLILARDRRAA